MNREIFLSLFFLVIVVIGIIFLDDLIILIDNIFKSSLLDKSYLVKIIIFVFIYALSICFLLPLGLVLMPLSGYLFGVFLGFILCNFSVMIGLLTIYFLVKKNLSDWLNTKIQRFLPKIKNIVNKKNISSLFLIRVMGIIPFSIQNILSAHITNKIIPYLFIPVFVMSPWTIVLNYLGSKLKGYSFHQGISVFNIAQGDHWIIFITLFYLIIFFIVIKNLKKKLN